MSSEIAISLTGVGKSYRLWRSPGARLSAPLAELARRFLPLRVANRLGLGPKDLYFTDFRALSDISLEVRRGETIGIVGTNGSGKSTLLQLVCGTLTPTEGKIKVNGRIAALLELGAGFNPEFTGRENVYLNGAVLGLLREEVEERMPAILAFADIGEFVDQPVKTYSSGMFVRLAFAVQAHVDPDILVVDEALAVGDALFQKRCYERIAALIARGTTLLFVSHDEESVRTLTNRAVLMREGRITCVGSSADVLLEYRRQLHEQEKAHLGATARKLADRAAVPVSVSLEPSAHARSFGDLEAQILEVDVLNENGEPQTAFHPTDLVRVRVKAVAHQSLQGLSLALRVRNKQGVKIYSWGTLNQDGSIMSGRSEGAIFWNRRFTAGEEFTVEFEWTCRLGTNLYEIQVALTLEGKPYYSEQRVLHWRDEAAFFSVSQEIPAYHFGGVADLKMRAKWI